MKALINWKQKAGLMALGSVFTIIGMLLSPISAQKDNKFGDIECTSLTVANDTLNTCTTSIGGLGIIISDVGGKEQMMLNGTSLIIWETEGKIVKIGVGGSYGVDGLEICDARDNEQVRIGVDEHGGYVSTYGRSKGYAIMGITDNGNGAVSTYDKNGYRQ